MRFVILEYTLCGGVKYKFYEFLRTLFLFFVFFFSSCLFFLSVPPKGKKGNLNL